VKGVSPTGMRLCSTTRVISGMRSNKGKEAYWTRLLCSSVLGTRGPSDCRNISMSLDIRLILRSPIYIIHESRLICRGGFCDRRIREPWNFGDQIDYVHLVSFISTLVCIGQVESPTLKPSHPLLIQKFIMSQTASRTFGFAQFKSGCFVT